MAKKPSLASTALAITKKILGTGVAAPVTVKMPKAVSEIHVSPTEYIPAGTMITDELAELAGFDADTLEGLEDDGHVVFVDVYAAALAPVAEPVAEEA